MERCVSGKVIYATKDEAERALVDAWIRNSYRPGSGPVAVYHCEDCKRFHFTSQGAMSATLKKALEDGSIEKKRNLGDWEDRFRF